MNPPRNHRFGSTTTTISGESLHLNTMSRVQNQGAHKATINQVHPQRGATKPASPKVSRFSNLSERLQPTNILLKLQQLSETVWPSVFGCIIIQAVAAFFYTITFQTFYQVVRNAQDFSNDHTKDLYTIFVVFFLFAMFSSAMCIPMIQKFGYTIPLLGGSVLMLFSTLASSMTASADILTVPYSTFGGCAYGVLRTAPQVAMADYLNDRLSLETGLSYLGRIIGSISASLSFALSDMADDARYDGSGQARWPNNMRVIEVTIVAAFLSCALLRKASSQTGKWPEVLKRPPLYILCFLYFFFRNGMRTLSFLYSSVPDDRNFQSSIKGTSEVMTPDFIGSLVGMITTVVLDVMSCRFSMESVKMPVVSITAAFLVILSFLSFINDVAYKEFWSFSIYTSVAGFVEAVGSITIPLALLMYSGKSNYKIAVPILEVAGEFGFVLAAIMLVEMEIPDDTSVETGWYVASAFILVASCFAFWAGAYHRTWIDEVGDDRGSGRLSEAEIEDPGAVEEEAMAVVNYDDI